MAGKKKIFFFLVAVIPHIFFAASFSGLAGIKGDFSSKNDTSGFNPQLNLSAFFSGQLDITSNFLVRSELSIQTSDVIETKLFSETDATFCIDELSFTYIKPFLGITQYFSAFLGNFEPIGSDVFLQRQFGISPITSRITESYLGLRGSTVFPFYGAGASYIIHVNNKPLAFGMSLYGNSREYKDSRKNQLNMDFRFATVLPFLTADFAAGFGAPLDNEYSRKKVILLIEELYLHTGVDLLIGNNYTNSLFIQAGFENLPIIPGNSKSEINSNELYILVEPRLYAKKFRSHLTFFSLPSQTVKKLSFIDEENTLGINLSVFTENLYINNKDFTFGFHTTLSFKDKDFFDLKRITEFFDSEFSIKVSPFVTLPVMSGELKFMLQAKLNGITQKTWQENFKFNIGYKSQL